MHLVNSINFDITNLMPGIVTMHFRNDEEVKGQKAK